ncbi:MAG: PorT family protein [Bacteroidaceae bacterium]|nr:PorT family protein [Bacteroidaceae bacterium]
MKKLFTMVVVALTTLTMSAQDEAKFTFKAGVGLSSIVGSDADTKTKFAYKVGASYDVNLAESFSLIPGIEFVNKGFAQDDIDGDINMFYVQVPVMAAFKCNLSDNMKLTLKAGPYASYGVLGSDVQIGYYSYNAFDMYEKFDAGIIAGFSLDINKFSVGAEYSRGLTKVLSGAKAYNQAYGIVVGYKF